METTEATGYKKPFRFGAQTIYKSDFLSEINLEHWKEFDAKAKTNDKNSAYTIADFIQNAVDITALQMIKFLREISEMESLEKVKEKASALIVEIAHEVDLEIKEKNTKKLEDFNKAKEEAKPVLDKEAMEKLMLNALCTAPEGQMETHIKEEAIAFRDKGGYTAGELYDYIQGQFDKYKHSWEMTDLVKMIINLNEHYKRPE